MSEDDGEMGEIPLDRATRVYGRANLPSLARMMNEVGGGGVRSGRCNSPTVSEQWLRWPNRDFPRPEICADPESTPNRFRRIPNGGSELDGAAVTDPREGASRGDTLDQVDKGWLGGPFLFDEDGRLVTGEGPQSADPAFRFGLQQDDKQRAPDGLKRGQTNRATATQTPVNLSTWGHFAAIIRTF